MNILTTPVIPAAEDAWWQPLPGYMAGMGSCKALVLCAGGPGAEGTAGRIRQMLGACRLADTDYGLFFLPGTEAVAWHRLREAANPEVVILLGIPPAQLGIRAQLQPHALAGFDGRQWIVSATPEAFFADNALRTHIWNQCLRPAFGIS